MGKRVIFHDLVTPEEAIRRVREHVSISPLPAEKVGLLDAIGRVLAEDIYSEVDVPPFDRAAVDGYAVRAEDTFGAFEGRPRRLRVVGSINAGEMPSGEVGEGEAMEIATGAPMPRGSDAVVPVEFTKREGDDVMVYSAVSPGENVVSAGSDIPIGDIVLRRGTLLLEREVAVLAAVGVGQVPVVRRPRVGIISSGSELIPPGRSLEAGKIYDVNSYSISSAVVEDGGLPIFHGIVRDNVDEMREVVTRAVEEDDLVIISGGTSAGLRDMTYLILDEIGPPGIMVHGIKVKPGKPTVISISKQGKLVFGLPGYPNSALIVYDLLVRPFLRELSGLGPSPRLEVRARLAKAVEGARGRRGYFPVNLVESREGLMAFPLPSESGVISSLALSDGYITIPEDVEFMKEGEEVAVRLFSSHYVKAKLYFIGSHDLMVDRLLGGMAKVLNVGSLEGIKFITKGVGDIAGTHLLDPGTMSYNIPYLERMKVKGVKLIAGYEREQGIVIAKGNPKRISGVEDFGREDLIIVNRNPGSGTRVLLDYLLEKSIGRDAMRKIKGYNTIVKTHSAVCAAVKYGRADAGLAVRYYAEKYGLDFIPLGWERYDFLVREDGLGKCEVKAFLNALKSERFLEELRNTPGYRPSKDIGEVVWEGL